MSKFTVYLTYAYDVEAETESDAIDEAKYNATGDLIEVEVEEWE